MANGYIIDPQDRSITLSREIDTKDTNSMVKDVYDLIGVSCFDVVRLSGDRVIYVDDDGMNIPWENQFHFAVEDAQNVHVLAGKALLVQEDGAQNIIDIDETMKNIVVDGVAWASVAGVELLWLDKDMVKMLSEAGFFDGRMTVQNKDGTVEITKIRFRPHEH